MEILNADISM